MNTNNTTEPERVRKSKIVEGMFGKRTWRTSWQADYRLSKSQLSKPFYALQSDEAIIAITMRSHYHANSVIDAHGNVKQSVYTLTDSIVQYLNYSDHKLFFNETTIMGENPTIVLCKYKPDYIPALANIYTAGYYSSSMANIQNIVDVIEVTEYKKKDLEDKQAEIMEELNMKTVEGKKAYESYVIDTIVEVVA